MKYLKFYENFNESDIHEICEKYRIRNYTINEDGSIDVDGNIDLYRMGLNKIPLNFRNTRDSFIVNKNDLTSLKDCTVSVGRNFGCSYNQLTSLEFCPLNVDNNFTCDNNKLTSLKFMPYIKGHFNCDNNNIRDFKYFIEPGGIFSCSNNPIYEIWKLFEDSSHIELLNDYDCIRGKDIVIDRLNQFLEEIDKPTVESVEGYNNI